MTSKLLARIAIGLIATLPAVAHAHSFDICAPQVTIVDPDSTPAAASPRSFIAQASLFLDRVPEAELRAAVRDIPAGMAVPATYLFNGSDTRWRLKSPLSLKETRANGVMGLPEQKQFLVPSDLTRPYGTIVVSGADNGPGVLSNPSMVAHLADGRGIVIEPHDLDAECSLELEHTVEAFLDGVAYYMDHHHHDTTTDNLREHEYGKESVHGHFEAGQVSTLPGRNIPEINTRPSEWSWSAPSR